MKIKSYTFHYYDYRGQLQKITYKVDKIMVKSSEDAKHLFYQNRSNVQVIYMTVDY